MVREGYRPVYAPARYSYGPVGFHGDWVQVMDFWDAAGQRYRAHYLMEPQADGSWRTSGCVLFAVREDAPSA